MQLDNLLRPIVSNTFNSHQFWRIRSTYVTKVACPSLTCLVLILNSKTGPEHLANKLNSRNWKNRGPQNQSAMRSHLSQCICILQNMYIIENRISIFPQHQLYPDKLQYINCTKPTDSTKNGHFLEKQVLRNYLHSIVYIYTKPILSNLNFTDSPVCGCYF